MADEINSIRSEAKALRESNNFSKAAELFRKLWNEVTPKEKWDGWGLAYCLNKLKQYDEAYKISAEVYNLDKEFDYIISQLSQASYLANIKNFPDAGDAAQLAKFVYEVISATDNKRADLFRIQSVLKMMDFSANKNYWEKVIEWSKHIDAANLSTEDFRGTASDGRKFIKPSDKETYYLKLAKAFDKLGKYDECRDICTEGLKEFPSQPWLLWHKGVSLSKLGSLDEAIILIEKASQAKKDWFVLRDLSAAYYRRNDFDKALQVFIDAAVNSVRIPNPGYRWELYFLGAKIYDKLGKQELANKHFALVYQLRSEEKGWSIQDFLQAEIDKRKINIENTSKELLNELTKTWRNEKESQLPLSEGTIKNFIREGKAGFIKADDGIDYYFRTSNLISKSLQVGEKVSFRIQKSFDKTKKRESLEALFITKQV